MSASATTGVIASAIAPTGGAWSPADLASLRGWWDFDISNVTKDGSNNISAAAALGGAASSDLEQGTGSAQPLWVDGSQNGLDGATFGGGEKMDNTFDSGITSGGVTVAIACRFGSKVYICNDRVDYYNWEFRKVGTALQLGKPGAYISSSSAFGSVAAVVVARYDHATNAATLRVNGADEASGSIASFGSITGFVLGARTVGGSDSGSMDYFEIVVANAVLTGSDLTSLETYLTDKWL